MGRDAKGKRQKWRDRWEYMSCDRKKKFKSAEASKIAARFNQRKYECHVCGQWHLTKLKVE